MAKARSAAGTLVRLLQESAAPLYVLDEERKLVFANAALLHWLGAEESALVGQRCDYHAASAEQQLTALLCPPPEAFAGERVSFVIRRPVAIETPEQRLAEAIPLGDSTAGAVALLVKMAESPCAEERAPQSSSPEKAESRILHEKLAAVLRRSKSRFRFDRLIGESPVMRRVRAQAELAARSPSGVLVVGPTGSGREHLARSIHLAAGKLAGPLVPLACPVIDAESLQATVRQLKRRLPEHQGEPPPILLLLNVDQLPGEAQDELAGFFNLPHFHLATIATSRRPLADLAAGAGFRHDLACLLGTLVIEIPPLAERREDLPLLAQMLLEEHNAQGGGQLAGFTPEALDELAAYPWPGNVDELAQFVAEACGRAHGPFVGTPDLPPRIRLASEAAAFPRAAEERIVLDEFLAAIERELIERALVQARQNRTRAAGMLGVSRARLHRRLVQLGLAVPAVDEAIEFEEIEDVSGEGEENP